MKRYLSSIIIAAVMVFSIGTFYIYTAVSASPFPNLKIVKESGNEKELKDIVVTGNYNLDRSNGNFNLSLDGTEYLSERSFMEKLDTVNDQIKALRKQYRNFMRGKTDLYSFFEDKDLLVYAEISPNKVGEETHSFDISTLKKKNKAKSSFSIIIPNNKQYSSIRILDVQRVGNEIKVITENYYYMNSNIEKDEIHLYTIDYIKKKVVKDNTIYTLPSRNSDIEIQFEQIFNTDFTIPNQYFVFKINKVKYKNMKDGSSEEELLKSELHAFNIETNKMKKIVLPKALKNAQIESYQNDSIYFTKQIDQQLNVFKLNIENNQLVSERKIPLSLAKDNYFILLKITNEKLYLLTNGSDQNVGEISVTDIQSGNPLYRGKIVKDGIETGEKKSKIEFYDIEVN